MQKMQAAAGGKPLGPNGQPSPAQIEAMRVSRAPSIIDVKVSLIHVPLNRKQCLRR